MTIKCSYAKLKSLIYLSVVVMASMVPIYSSIHYETLQNLKIDPREALRDPGHRHRHRHRSFPTPTQQLDSQLQRRQRKTGGDGKPPTLFYHPGPPKTGTTTLQCSLAKYQQELKDDGVVLMGKIPQKFCPQTGDDTRYERPYIEDFGSRSSYRSKFECLFDMPCMRFAEKDYLNNRTSRSWNELEQTIDELYNRKQDLLLSDECHSMYHASESCLQCHLPKMIAKLFSRWRVVLIFGYRDYVDYLLSFQREMDRIDARHIRLTRWPSPMGNGRKLKSLTQILREEEIKFPNRYMRPRTHSTSLYYQDRFPSANTSILNLHDEDHVATLLCHIIQSPKACQARLENGLFREKLNPMQMNASDYDRIAVEAASRGWIDTTLISRLDALNRTGELISRQSLEYDCLTKRELDQLLKKSLHVAKETLAEVDQEVHAKRFQRSTSRLCSVDVNRTLDAHSEWEQSFRSWR